MPKTAVNCDRSNATAFDLCPRYRYTEHRRDIVSKIIPRDGARKASLELWRRAAARDKCIDRLALRPDRRATRGSYPHRWTASGSGRCRLRQDAGDHPPGCLSAFAGRSFRAGPGLDFHQQGRRRDARAHPGAGAAVASVGRNISRLLRGLLRKYAKLVGIDPGFSIYDQNDRLRAIRDITEQFDWKEPGLTAERIEPVISRAKNDLIGPRQSKQRAFDRKTEMIAQVYELYEVRLKAASAVDFDDLLVHVVAILKEHKDVRADLDRHYRYVLVDEYQDTNLAQYAIVRGAFGRSPQSLRHRRSRSVDLRLARGQPGQHPRIRARLSRLPGRHARTELSQHQEYPQRRRSLDPVQSQPQAQVALDRKPAGRAGRADALSPRNRRGRDHRREDRQPGARGRLPLLRYCRLLPGDRPDTAFRASPPRSPDPLPDRRRLRILRATGNQGCTFILEFDRESQGRSGVRAGGQRSATGRGEDLDGTSGGRGARGASRFWRWHETPGRSPSSKTRPSAPCTTSAD